MEKESAELVADIGGLQLPGENLAGYWFRVSEKADLGWRSVRAAWHGERVSKKTREKLERAAKNASQTDDVVTFTEHYIRNWRKDPQRHQRRIDLAQQFIDRLREFDLEISEMDRGQDQKSG